MSETEPPQTQTQTFSRLDVGVLIVLVAMAIAGVVELIGVLAADSNAEAVSVGVATLVVLSALWVAALAARRVERAPES